MELVYPDILTGETMTMHGKVHFHPAAGEDDLVPLVLRASSPALHADALPRTESNVFSLEIFLPVVKSTTKFIRWWLRFALRMKRAGVSATPAAESAYEILDHPQPCWQSQCPLRTENSNLLAEYDVSDNGMTLADSIGK